MGYRARLAAAAGMTAAFVSIGIVVHDGRVLGLAIPYLVYFTWIVLSRPGKAEVEIRRKIHPARVPVGEEIEVVLTAENHGPDITSFGLEEVLPDGVTAADGETSVLAPLPTGEKIEVSYTIHPSRGEYEFPPVVVKRWGRFSSAPQVERIEIPSSLLVFPRPEPLEEIVIRPRRTLVYSGTVKANVGGEDVETLGLLRTRGYQVILVAPDPLDRWREANTGKTDAASLQLAARIIRLDRRVLLDTLARIGVEVVDWRIDEPLARTTDWALSRRGRRFR